MDAGRQQGGESKQAASAGALAAMTPRAEQRAPMLLQARLHRACTTASAQAAAHPARRPRMLTPEGMNSAQKALAWCTVFWVLYGEKEPLL